MCGHSFPVSVHTIRSKITEGMLVVGPLVVIRDCLHVSGCSVQCIAFIHVVQFLLTKTVSKVESSRSFFVNLAHAWK